MFQNGYEAGKPCFIRFREAVKVGAVDIQDAPDGAVFVDRKDDLRIGGAVAGNMTGKSMDIGDKKNRVLCRGGTADALANGDQNAGGFSLEGP